MNRNRTGVYHYEQVKSDQRSVITIPPYGYFDGIDVRLKEPAPNMDSRARYLVLIDIIAPDGSHLAFETTARFENVS
jgi:hypothetical protein